MNAEATIQQLIPEEILLAEATIQDNSPRNDSKAKGYSSPLTFKMSSVRPLALAIKRVWPHITPSEKKYLRSSRE